MTPLYNDKSNMITRMTEDSEERFDLIYDLIVQTFKIKKF